MGSSTYRSAYERSLRDPDGFWGEAGELIQWTRPWERVLDASGAPFYRWYVGGETNTCYNALDYHVEHGRADQPALIYDSPVTGTVATWTFRELRDDVARFAGALQARGVSKGDRVVIYMPMVPEAAIAMLACARIGAIHSVVFGGFAARELATRIDDAKPKAVLAASCGVQPGGRTIDYKSLLDGALDEARHQPEFCVILQRPEAPVELVPGRDIDWRQFQEQASPVACTPLASTDPLYVLYTSGTTGKPKGVVRDNGGHAVALKWSMQNFYGVQPGEVYWAASDVGWVVGHSYIVYGPLLNGNTTVLYEGKPVGTPDAGAFWRVISQHGISALFTAPTAFRAIKRHDPQGELIRQYDLSCFRTLFLAGEHCDPDTLEWAQKHLGVPVIDHWWQTETAWAITGNCMGIEPLPVKPGSTTAVVPGYDLRILDNKGEEMPAGEIGSIAIRLPLPPGSLLTLWENDDGCRRAYFDRYPGFYLTGDAGFRDSDGYPWVMSRIDDIINVAGHRLSTGLMEEVIASHPDVAECAVVGVADELKGQLPVGLVVLKSGVTRAHERIIDELIELMRARVGPVAAFKQAIVVERLPKTRSGKVLRNTMRKIADGEAYNMPPTIDDPVILDEIAESLGALGYPRN